MKKHRNMEDLIQLSKSLRMLFERKHDLITLPFFFDFPNNCCEGSSCILGWLLTAEFPDSTVKVIHGVDQEYEKHCWLQVDGLIYDLTLDQFPSFLKPIYAQSIHPMSTRFSKTTEYYALEFVVQYSKNSANIEDIEAAYNYVKHEIRNYI